MAIAPAPGAVPLLGHLPAYMRDPLAFFSSCGNGTGSVVECRLAGAGYLLREPEDIRHVLVRNQAGYVKARRLTGPRARYPDPSTLLTSAGEVHRRKRIAIQRIFRRSLSERVEDRARVNAAQLAASWAPQTELALPAAMRTLAQRNILELLFGAGAPGIDAVAEASAARRRAIERVLFSAFPLPEFVPGSANVTYARATRSLRDAVAIAIAERRSAPRDDIVSELVGVGLSDEEVSDEVITFSLTGYDSVSEALAWTLMLVAGRPDVADAVAGGDGALATAAVRESLRLYPPTWLFARIAVAEDMLPSGARLPAAAKVYLCPWVVHRDPRLWEDPERFDPSRFAPDARGERERYAYFPFGGGSHVCIAETLAMAQVVAVLETITAAHRLTTVGGPAAPLGGLTLSPHPGLRVRSAGVRS
jgi:cytochrome P450